MRAVVIREFGPPEVLEGAEVATAEAGPGQVVIEVELANITFVETQVRAGKPPHPAMLPALPPSGRRISGTVAGRRVVASLNGTGGYAERVAVDAGRPVQVPDGLALRDAVALLADGRTALALVRRAGLRAGEVVLVEAAAGGVGTLLVQLARNAEARVVALVGQERKLAVARELGADVAVDYRRRLARTGQGGGRAGGRGVRRGGRGHRPGRVRAAGRGRAVLPVRHGQRELHAGHARSAPRRTGSACCGAPGTERRGAG